MEEESKTKFSMNVEFSFAFKKNPEKTMKTLAFVIRLTYNEVRKIK